jgi:hypothetical protein
MRDDGSLIADRTQPLQNHQHCLCTAHSCVLLRIGHCAHQSLGLGAQTLQLNPDPDQIALDHRDLPRLGSRVREIAIEHRLGDKIRLSDVWAEAIWSAIANTRWEHANGYTAASNTQAAGDLIAAIRGVGDYRHWDDNCRVYKSIPGMILKMMAEEGWSPDLKRRENGSSFA